MTITLRKHSVNAVSVLQCNTNHLSTTNELINGTIEPQKSEINNKIDILHVKQVASRTILHVNKPIAKNFHLQCNKQTGLHVNDTAKPYTHGRNINNIDTIVTSYVPMTAYQKWWIKISFKNMASQAPVILICSHGIETYRWTRVKFFYIPALQPPHSPITAVTVVELGHQAVVFCITRQARSCWENPFQSDRNCQILHGAVPRKHPVRLHPFYKFYKYTNLLKSWPTIPEPCWRENSARLSSICCMITPRKNKNFRSFHAKRRACGLYIQVWHNHSAKRSDVMAIIPYTSCRAFSSPFYLNTTVFYHLKLNPLICFLSTKRPEFG